MLSASVSIEGNSTMDRNLMTETSIHLIGVDTRRPTKLNTNDRIELQSEIFQSNVSFRLKNLFSSLNILSALLHSVIVFSEHWSRKEQSSVSVWHNLGIQFFSALARKYFSALGHSYHLKITGQLPNVLPLCIRPCIRHWTRSSIWSA